MSWSINTPVERSRAYDAAWATACRLKEFNYNQLAAEASISIDLAMGCVKSWERVRAVEFVGIGDKRRKIWRVLAEVLPHRTRSDGSLIRQATVQGNLWRSMRGLLSFSAVDLAAHSNTPDTEVTVEAAREYCQMLVRAAYLRVERKALPGRREAIYRLIRNTGPRPPTERRVRAVYDGNLEKLVHVAGHEA